MSVKGTSSRNVDPLEGAAEATVFSSVKQRTIYGLYREEKRRREGLRGQS